MSDQQPNQESKEDEQNINVGASASSFLEQFQPTNDFNKLGFLGQTSLPSTLTSSELVGIQALGAMTNNVDFNEKIAIYQHPLFPLLRVLFEKCEAATKSIDQADTLIFKNEIKTYISEMTKGNKPFFTNDAEVDSLVRKLVFYILLSFSIGLVCGFFLKQDSLENFNFVEKIKPLSQI